MATFACPTCQKPVEWNDDARWRPFCSERCRLIDLGAWMSEQRSIPGEGGDPDAVPAATPGDGGDEPPRH